ncbi:MAG: hypothetical protein HYS16_01485 [Deltaproteobacteria bacterium]|nr:MAG: hypothetical protein HYS16_01485 [Deltaproteobacteria bacterium]
MDDREGIEIITSFEEENIANFIEHIHRDKITSMVIGESEFQWYLFTINAKDPMKVLRIIEARISRSELRGSFSRIFVPKHFISIIERSSKGMGGKIEKDKSWILIRMKLTLETCYTVLGSTGVACIKVDLNDIVEVVTEKFLMILYKINKRLFVDEEKQESDGQEFYAGDEIFVTKGSFANFYGKVKEVDMQRKKLKVLLLILGRTAPVEVSFSQVSHVA